MTEKLEWSDSYLLGYIPMDETHEEFVALVNAMREAKPSELPACLKAFEEHAVRHFGQEDEWMTKNEFPAGDCHIDEHAKVLESVRHVLGLPIEQMIPVSQGLISALEHWFPGHADYLDSALAKWMVKQSFGGARVAPVVLRRNPKFSETEFVPQSDKAEAT